MSKEVITSEVVDSDRVVRPVEVNVVAIETRQELVQAKAENLGNICEEILDDIRTDREQHMEVAKMFLDMVINEGDASTSTKEAAVALIKNLSDLSDKKIRVMEVLMKSFLKPVNTTPKYQHNQITIEGSKRDMIKDWKREQHEDET